MLLSDLNSDPKVTRTFTAVLKKNPDKETDSIPDQGFHDWRPWSQMLSVLLSNTWKAMPLISTLLTNFLLWLPYLPINGLMYRQTDTILRLATVHVSVTEDCSAISLDAKEKISQARWF